MRPESPRPDGAAVAERRIAELRALLTAQQAKTDEASSNVRDCSRLNECQSALTLQRPCHSVTFVSSTSSLVGSQASDSRHPGPGCCLCVGQLLRPAAWPNAADQTDVGTWRGTALALAAEVCAVLCVPCSCCNMAHDSRMQLAGRRHHHCSA